MIVVEEKTSLLANNSELCSSETTTINFNFYRRFSFLRSSFYSLPQFPASENSFTVNSLVSEISPCAILSNSSMAPMR